MYSRLPSSFYCTTQVDYEEKSALHFAAANGLGEVVKLLADAKADVTLKVRVLSTNNSFFWLGSVCNSYSAVWRK